MEPSPHATDTTNPQDAGTVSDRDVDPSVDSAVDSAPDESGPCCGGATRWLAHDAAREHAQRLAAIADPIRLQIASIIANAPAGEVCACDFVEPLGRSQPTISHHLKVLAEAGLVTGDKRGRWVWYRLESSRLHDLSGVLADVCDGRV